MLAEFAETPSSVTVELGTTPLLRCRHVSQGANISWLVNGSSVEQFPRIRSGSVNEYGNIVYTLTIPAEPQYNGTEIVCLAVFYERDPIGFEATPTATIFIIPTDSLPDTTHFDIIPSPLTVAVEQGYAIFQCQHQLADAIGWRVNGIPLNTAALQNVSTTSVGTTNGVTTILSIATLLVYNRTTIECIATFIDGSSPQLTAPIVLLIQGTFYIT